MSSSLRFSSIRNWNCNLPIRTGLDSLVKRMAVRRWEELCRKGRIPCDDSVPSEELTYPTWGKGKIIFRIDFSGDMLVSERVVIACIYLANDPHVGKILSGPMDCPGMPSSRPMCWSQNTYMIFLICLPVKKCHDTSGVASPKTACPAKKGASNLKLASGICTGKYWSLDHGRTWGIIQLWNLWSWVRKQNVTQHLYLL